MRQFSWGPQALVTPQQPLGREWVGVGIYKNIYVSVRPNQGTSIGILCAQVVLPNPFLHDVYLLRCGNYSRRFRDIVIILTSVEKDWI